MKDLRTAFDRRGFLGLAHGSLQAPRPQRRRPPSLRPQATRR